jgi:hypothetical protein
LLYSPLSIALWFGSEVDDEMKIGSLRIIRAFSNEYLGHIFGYIPAYLENRQQADTL